MSDKPTPWYWRLRSWLAGQFFLLAGRLDPDHFDVWLDYAPRRHL